MGLNKTFTLFFVSDVELSAFAVLLCCILFLCPQPVCVQFYVPFMLNAISLMCELNSWSNFVKLIYCFIFF